MPKKNLQNTDYRGAVIDNNMADALKRTPVGQELFRYEPYGDKTILQGKLPEMGRYIAEDEDDELDGREYNIRVNMNYFVRGMIRSCMDPDGNIDPNKVEELTDLCEEINYKTHGEKQIQKVNQLIDKLQIPASQRREFEVFLKANNVPNKEGGPVTLLNSFNGPIVMFFGDISGSVLKYQEAMKGNYGAAEQQFANKYQLEYENTLRSYQEMANMDPKTETRIMYPGDCEGFTALTSEFIKQNNNYREAHHKPALKVTPTSINMSAQEETDGKMRAFDVHHYLTTDVTLNLPNESGKKEKTDYTISIETTAPPAGSPFFRPEVERTGIGIYNNAQEVEDFHRSQNLRSVTNFDVYSSLNDRVISRVGQPFTIKLEMPEDKNFLRYYQLHTGKYASALPNKKLAEYTAKAASAIKHTYDKDTAFDVSIPRKEAEVMQKSPAFKAVLRAAGPEKIRNILKNKDGRELTELIAGNEKRYAMSDQAKEKLRKLGEGMNMNRKKPDKTWDDLHQALTKGDLKNSEYVFQTVESFVKGKKSLKNDPVRQESVDLALDALSIVAQEGDEVAKARAQILVDRFNTVRGAKKPGDKGFVDLNQHAEKFKGQPQPKEKETNVLGV